jgi:membrane peptidoglycan carboxypeptidase
MSFSPKRAGSVAYSAVMFLVVSMVAGLLVAGLAVPVAAMAGVGGRAAEKTVEELPRELATPPQPVRTKVTMGNGETLAYFYDQDRTYKQLDDIAPIMRKAQLAIEDHRYYEHGALDVQGTLRALLSNAAAGGVSQGGSSITQQYVKMVRIQQAELSGDEKGIAAAQDDTYARKIEELKYAIALEKKFSKDEILERYLNIAYYGDGAYGVEAAARHYFRTSAKKLTLPQAAMLAGLVRNPNVDNPAADYDAAISRRNVVLQRMAELGVISADQASEAKEADYDADQIKTTPNGCIGSRYPFLCNYVYKSMLKMPTLGKTEQDRINAIKRGGLTIETAIDPKTQDAAQEAVSEYVSETDPVISTMSMIQPGTGLIIGMAQSRPEMGDDEKKGETYYSYPAPPDLGGSPGGFQSGSTFKAITLAAALEEGVSPSKTYNAARRMDMSNSTWRTCNGTVTIGDYKPKNSTAANGVMDMRRAAAGSVNTYFLQLEKTIGLCPVVKMAKKLGVKLASGQDIEDSDYAIAPSLTLGVANIAPLSLAEAYATFAARGVHCDPIIIDKITKPNGDEIEPPSANCKRVISKDVADGVNSILQGVMQGSGTGARAALPDGRPQAGKTGTTDENQAVWFAGYTPDLAGVASIAEDVTQKPFKKPNDRAGGLLGYQLDTGIYIEGSGGGDAGEGIWEPAMRKALKGIEPSDFADYRNSDTSKDNVVEVPAACDMSRQNGTDALETAGFSVIPTSIHSNSAAGSWLGFSQCGGKLPKYSTIYSLFSAGPAPKPDPPNNGGDNNDGGKKKKPGTPGGDGDKNDDGKKKKPEGRDGDNGGKKKNDDDGGGKKKNQNR